LAWRICVKLSKGIAGIVPTFEPSDSHIKRSGHGDDDDDDDGGGGVRGVGVHGGMMGKWSVADRRHLAGSDQIKVTSKLLFCVNHAKLGQNRSLISASPLL
jgi:hypothetical protein